MRFFYHRMLGFSDLRRSFCTPSALPRHPFGSVGRRWWSADILRTICGQMEIVWIILCRRCEVIVTHRPLWTCTPTLRAGHLRHSTVAASRRSRRAGMLVVPGQSVGGALVDGNEANKASEPV